MLIDVLGQTGGAAGQITIAGGTIAATGGSMSAGIGGGRGSKGGSVNIYGGNVLIAGGTVYASSTSGAFGIGGGRHVAGVVSPYSYVTITGGNVSATGGIGGWRSDVRLDLKNESDSVLSDAFGTEQKVTVGKLLLDEDDPTAFFSGSYEYEDTVVLAGHKLVLATGGTLSFDDGGGNGEMEPVVVGSGATYALPACGFEGPDGAAFRYWRVGTKNLDAGVTIALHGDAVAKACWIGSIPYIGEGGEELSRAYGDYEFLTAETAALDGGWHVVEDNVSLDERVEVTGDVSLILCEGVTLEATKGFHVGSGASLTVYGQGDDSGVLVARGSEVPDYEATDGYAGIGANGATPAGTIAIVSGVVDADSIGTLKGADGRVWVLGGSVTTTRRLGGDGTAVIIEGGKVSATARASGQPKDRWDDWYLRGQAIAIGGEDATVRIMDGEVDADARVSLGGNVGDAQYFGVASAIGGKGSSVTFEGGKINAYAELKDSRVMSSIGSYGCVVGGPDATVSLGWKNASDSITAISGGISLDDNSAQSICYQGTVSFARSMQDSKIAGNVLRPGVTVHSPLTDDEVSEYLQNRTLVPTDSHVILRRDKHGTESSPIQILEVQPGETLVLPASPWEAPSGKSFVGWQVGYSEDLVLGDLLAEGSEITPEGDLDVYAIWGSAWAGLQVKINNAKAGEAVALVGDVVAEEADTALVVPEGKELTLDLAGHALDRGHGEAESAVEGGNAISNLGTLTIADSSDDGTGAITGGFNAGDGGAVANLGALTIAGGALRGNRAGGDRAGGAVANFGALTIADGTFSGNSAGEAGAVYNAPGATLEVSGGAFSGNEATHEGWGGGAIVNKGEMSMSGGEASGNSAPGNGGGVYTSGPLALSGGTIEGNVCGGNGGGVYMNVDGSLSVSGEPVVWGNADAGGSANDVYLLAGKTISVASDLTGGARVGVLYWQAQTYTFTSGMASHAGGVGAKAFASDRAGYAVTSYGGEARLKAASEVSIAATEHGRVEADVVEACDGDVVTLTVIPDEGFALASLSVATATGRTLDARAGAVGTYTFKMPSVAVTVNAAFEPAPAFVSQRLILSGQVGFAVTMSLPEVEGVDWSASSVTFHVGHPGGRRERDVEVAYVDSVPGSDGTLRSFTVPLSSVEMAEPVTATLRYERGGEERTLSKGGLSIKGYVEGFDARQAETGEFDGETVALVHAVADYGHWVQPFLAATNRWEVGDGDNQYAQMDKFYTTSYDRDAVREALVGCVMSKQVVGSAVTKATASLELESETALDVILTVADGIEPVVTYAELGDDAVNVGEPVRLGGADGGGVRWRVRVFGIRAWQLGDEVVVTGDAGGEFEVRASGLAYASALLGVADYAGNGGHDAMCALVAFHDAEVAYRAKHRA